MRRRVTVLLGSAMLVGWAVPALAHVTAEDPSVPKDSEAEITFSVPVEEGGHTHGMQAMHAGEAGEAKGEPSDVYNEEVTIEVPRGFEVISCDQTTDWKCSAEPNKGSPSAGQAHGGTVTFTRVTKSGTSMDHLSFTVHTPEHPGTYSFPTSQKLSDGDETEWKGGGPTSEHPAPTVRVVDEG
jgi:periplasmic copper chaperone A